MRPEARCTDDWAGGAHDNLADLLRRIRPEGHRLPKDEP